MAFSSPLYLPFLAVASCLVLLAPAGTFRLLVMLAISAAFYLGLGPYWYVLPLVAVASYVGAVAIEKVQGDGTRLTTFVCAVILTLLPLLTFKYAPAISHLIGVLDSDIRLSGLTSLVLPIGISFYTFLAVGYLIDVYVGNIAAERSVLRYAVFMSFFPQLTAGPIERAGRLLPQLSKLGNFDYRLFSEGLRQILLGLFMKVVIADSLAPFVDKVYSDPRQYGLTDLVLATGYFSFQVYADFAGYSLIAIGSAKLLGIELMTNFQQPYLSQTLPEYWRRWHISLSSWFRDYVFVPLQFSIRRRGTVGLAAALIFTFVLVGVWHGAGPQYGIFGLIHGILVAYSTITLTRRNKLWKKTGIHPQILRWGRSISTFIVISLTFILFRSNGIDDAGWMYAQLFVGELGTRTVPLTMPLVWIAMLIAGDLVAASKFKFSDLATWQRWGIYYIAFAFVVLYWVKHAAEVSPYGQQFIYFKF